jgi:hypothetical protein
VPRSFSHRRAFERQPLAHLSMERRAGAGCQTSTETVVRQTPVVFAPDYSKPVGVVLIILALGIALAKWLEWVVTLIDLK